MPKVSVVIPNYNHAHYLDKRIQSVLNQTYQDFELVYLDDASTDNSNEVFQRYAPDPRIRAVINESNSGCVFKQWNRGFREAQGEYIWVAESDDLSDSRFLETLVARLDSHPKVGVAYCQSMTIDEHDNLGFIVEREWWGKWLDTRHWTSDFVNNGVDECAKYLIVACTIPNISAALIRRSSLERAGYADESMTLSGDWKFWSRLLMASDIAYVAQPLNYWRRHTGSVTSKAMRNGVYIEEAYKIIKEINSRIDIPKESLQKSAEYWCRQWILYSPVLEIGFNKNRYIYSLAKSIDPNLVTNILVNLLRKPNRILRSQARRILKRSTTNSV